MLCFGLRGLLLGIHSVPFGLGTATMAMARRLSPRGPGGGALKPSMPDSSTDHGTERSTGM